MNLQFILHLRIASALRSSQEPSTSKLIVQNTIYNHPSIQSLAEYIVGLMNPENSVQSVPVVAENDEHVRLMKQ